MSRVLVTGGSGFIGSHVVDRLLADGHEPRVYDLCPSTHHDAAEVEMVVGDVRDLDALAAAADGCHAVMHLAAVADVADVVADPVRAEELNARGTLNVLEAARRAGACRVVYASTIWVYSELCRGVVDEETPLPPPEHLYTATKLAGELYCRSYSSLYDVDVTILRFGIPYGPRARPAAVLPTFVSRALAGEPLTIAGGGTQSRRFVYVEDLAAGCVRALRPEAANRTFNLVGDEEVTVREIASTVGGLVGDVEIVHVDGRQADFGGAEVSGSRARTELGWNPSVRFHEGARRYVEWHQQSQATPAEPASERLRAVARNSLVALCALFAGGLIAPLASLHLLGDPDGIVAWLFLLVTAMGIVAGIDWARDRLRGALVLAALTTGVLVTTALLPHTEDLIDLARAHRWVSLLGALTALAATTFGWRARRARPAEEAA